MRYTPLLLLVSSCAALQTIPDVIPPPGPGGDESDCEAACAHLVALDCEEGDPTPGKDGYLGTDDDGTCIDMCENTQNSPVTLMPACVVEIDTCEQVNDCVTIED